MLGVEAADHLILGTEEPTMNYPDIVNAKKDGVGRTPFRALERIAAKKAAAPAKKT